MKKIVRKTAVALVMVAAVSGVVAAPTAAEADTGWSWRVVPGGGR
jgi:hypothetical protein